MSVPVYPFHLPPLRYAYDALEPQMSASRLRRHHGVEHQAHIAALNAALQYAPELHGRSIEDIMRHVDGVPESVRSAVRTHGGGHANHQFFWKILGKHEGAAPSGALATALTRTFGGQGEFERAFHASALALSGPGWAFLVVDGSPDCPLEIIVLPDHATVLERGQAGVLCCDLWDHAHEGDSSQSERAHWLESFWQILAWDVASRRFDAILAGASQL